MLRDATRALRRDTTTDGKLRKQACNRNGRALPLCCTGTASRAKSSCGSEGKGREGKGREGKGRESECGEKRKGGEAGEKKRSFQKGDPAIQPRGLGSPESGTKVTNTEEVLEDSVTLKGGDDYEQYQESGLGSTVAIRLKLSSQSPTCATRFTICPRRPAELLTVGREQQLIAKAELKICAIFALVRNLAIAGSHLTAAAPVLL
ncbi:hypothetical protein AXG93_815s1390 [Marchantia polymorpha subsp. ruderalis]|uniref:Uncharacterized protein n=1 Tax=Marchantia polymorpha subsp. ruderalis TaxID=1480154 RepID=A0A176W2P5_MARPO|nr:hypothetical protein AXG93_815s1390 [Marchantia polymorpha subsp. ruderalis]